MTLSSLQTSLDDLTNIRLLGEVMNNVTSFVISSSGTHKAFYDIDGLSEEPLLPEWPTHPIWSCRRGMLQEQSSKEFYLMGSKRLALLLWYIPLEHHFPWGDVSLTLMAFWKALKTWFLHQAWGFLCSRRPTLWLHPI